jgi:hypothetical protein
MRIPLGSSDYLRSIAETPAITLKNRYFESDPTNQKDQIALLSRPALSKWLTMATASVRATYSQPGSFDEALFVMSGNTLYRIDQDETVSTIGTLSTSTGYVSMAATETHLFVADGVGLKYYTDDGTATGTLTASGAISSGDQVKIGSTYYQFTSGDVNAGAPAGTSSNPWLVAMGASTAIALQNLYNAIDDLVVSGVVYSLVLTANPSVSVNSVSATTVVVRAKDAGTAGNAIATTETGANLAWGAVTLAGGGGTTFASVTVPDSDGIISVGVIAGYTICVVAQGRGKNGRYYWIEPGEIIIDPLNFATAERSPDPVWNVVVSGDQFWLPGSSTIEVWYPSGDALAPFFRQQGRLFERGAWEGTVVPLGEAMMLVDSTGDVWEVADAPQMVSTPGIAQRIREAINAQRAA